MYFITIFFLSHLQARGEPGNINHEEGFEVASKPEGYNEQIWGGADPTSPGSGNGFSPGAGPGNDFEELAQEEAAGGGMMGSGSRLDPSSAARQLNWGDAGAALETLQEVEEHEERTSSHQHQALEGKPRMS